jgi:hypothetical protein
VLTGMTFVCLMRSLDTDLWWHLADGGYIYRHGRVPTSDFLSFSVPGHTWHDFEWLCELIMFSLYHASGLWLVQAVFAGMIVATFALVLLNGLRLGVNGLLMSFLLLPAFAASFTFLAARPQMVTLLFLAVFALILQLFRETRSRRLLVLLPVLAALWANLHAGYAVGLGLLLLTCMGEAMNIATRAPSSLKAADVRWLTGISLASVVATALNPYGVAELVFPVSYVTGSPYTGVLNEWSSPDFHLATMLPFECLVLGFIFAALIARPSRNWVHVLSTVAFTALALSAIRNIAVWCVVLLPLVGLYTQQAVDRLGPRRRIAWSSLGSRRTALNSALFAVTLLLCGLAGALELRPGLLLADERHEFPTGATAYLSRYRLSPRLFATYSWSGYALWRLYPGYRDFIDGRANTVFANRVLASYITAYNAEPGWSLALDRYRVGEVLVEPSAPIASVLSVDRSWWLAYRDARSALFVRRARLNPGRGRADGAHPATDRSAAFSGSRKSSNTWPGRLGPWTASPRCCSPSRGRRR